MLSIIIVSYNVKYFVEQCLHSVRSAIAQMDAEVIVVDNSSADESVAYLQEKFSWVIFVANKDNYGYAKASNQGLQMAKGNYVLFLNPDTILGEDCLATSLQVLQQDDHIGALGIRMMDGTGRFLPESKRGFPSPEASFYKLSGLIRLFPRSHAIARYYMGWLPQKENNAIDVLSGAYMMVKREVLEKTGGFDEQFFMYGEDIDLSYRIRQAGYTNYYLGEHAIIHFKGESTQKDIRYTRLFYKAMGIFVQKHYVRKSGGFNLFMQTAIAVSGAIAFGGRLFSPRVARVSATAIHTVLVGAQEETQKAAAILMSDATTQRKITCLPAIKAISSALLSAKPDEIVFCAGTLQYKDIVGCVEELAVNMEYKFFAAGSNSIVGSVSRNNSGKIIVLSGGKAEQ